MNCVVNPESRHPLGVLSTWAPAPLVGRPGPSPLGCRLCIAGCSRLAALGPFVPIGADFVAAKIAPHVNTRHALSTAVDSRSAADVNLKLFDILGRVALMGLWAVWSGNRASDEEVARKSDALAKACFDQAMALIETNPALALPAVDHQATDIALVLVLWILCNGPRAGVASWLMQMTARLCFTIRSRTRYPIT